MQDKTQSVKESENFYQKKIVRKKNSQISSQTEFCLRLNLSRTQFCLGLHTAVVLRKKSFN